MKGYNICGMQQMGVGVTDIVESWDWYIKKFGTDCKIFDDKEEAKLMLPYTGGKTQKRRAVLAINLQSGGGFEIWQYQGRKPQPKDTPLFLGDYGINYCKIKAKNVDAAYKAIASDKECLINEPTIGPDDKKSFFIKDPAGNIFQIVEAYDWFVDEGKPTGGGYGAIIGVSDIEKSMTVYSDILGYSQVAYDVTGVFEDFKALRGGDAEVRRVLLKRPNAPNGPFSRLLGQSEIELVCVKERTPQKIFEGRFWGDPGFIHLCFDMQGMNALRDYCSEKGFPFTVDSNPTDGTFDMGEAAGHFSYIEDPDGTLIEFVETHKVPILQKLGWYIDLTKKKQGENLPKWMLKALRFSKVKNAE